MSESDNESVTSTQSGFPALTGTDLPSQFAELVERVERTNSKINHVRKSVRRLKEKVAQTDIMVPADGKSLSSEQTVALGERFVERASYKHQMKQIMRQLEDIKEKSAASVAELREGIEAVKRSANDERVDQLTGTIKSSHDELSKSITQLKAALELSKGQLNTAIKGTYDYAKGVKKDLEELKKAKNDDVVAQMKKEMDEMKAQMKEMSDRLEQHEAKIKVHDGTGEKLTRLVKQTLASVKDEISRVTKPLKEKIDALEGQKASGGTADANVIGLINELKTKVFECEVRDKEIMKDVEGVKVLAEGLISRDIRGAKEKISAMRIDVDARIKELAERATKIEEILEKLDDRFKECGEHADSKIEGCEKAQEEKNAELRALVEELKKGIADIKAEQNEFVASLDGVKAKTDELVTEDQNIRADLDKAVEQLKAAGQSTATEVVQAQCEMQAKDMSALKEELEKLQKSMTDELEQKVSQFSALSGRIDEISGNVSECKTHRDSLTEELKNLKNKVDSMEIMGQTLSVEKSAELSGSLSELLSREEKLSAAIEELRSGLSAVRNEVSEVNSGVEAHKQEGNERHEQLTNEVNALKSEVEKQNADKSETQQATISKFEELGHTLETINAQMVKKEEFDGIRAKLEECQSQREGLAEGLRNVKNKIDSMEIMSQTLSAEKSAELSGSLSELLGREEKLNSAIEDLKSSLSTAQNDIKALNQKAEEHAAQKLEAEGARTDACVTRCNDLEEQVKELANHIQSLEKQLETNEATDNEANAQIAKLQERLTACETANTDMKAQTEQLQGKLEHQNQEIQAVQLSMTSQFTTLNTELDKAMSSVSEISDKVHAKESTMHAEIAALQEKADNCKGLDEDTQKEITEKFAALEAKFGLIEQNAADITTLKEHLDTYDEDKKAINEKLEELAEQGKGFNTSLESHVKIIDQTMVNSIQEIRQEMTLLTNTTIPKDRNVEIDESAFEERFNALKIEVDSIHQWMNGIDKEKLCDGAETVRQFGVVIDEMKAKMEEVEKHSGELSDEFTKTKDAVKEVQDMTTEIRDDYTTRMSDLEYVGSQDRAEAMKQIKQLESDIENLNRQLSDFPRMINSTMEDNQIAMKNLSEKIDGEISDMKSQLQQASFADEEIDELRGKFEELKGETKQFQGEAKDHMESIDRQLIGLKTAEQEHIKIWSAINDLKTAQDVQANTVNPMFTQQISQLTSKVTADGEGEAEQRDQVTPQVVADIEILRRKLESLEHGMVEDKQSVLSLSEQLGEIKVEVDITAQKIRSEMQAMRASLPDSFVELETFRGLKSELQIIQNAASDNVQSRVEERELIQEQLDGFNRVLKEMQSKLAGENPEMGAIPEVIGATQSASPGEISDLKMMINGIDLATQRQLRKLKRSIRKIEKMIEDAQEEERRLLEQQAKEEEQREIEEEEEGLEDGETSPDKSELVLAPAVGRTRGDSRITGRLSSGPLPSAVEVIQDDFQIFFVLMFAVLLYFLVADIFRA